MTREFSLENKFKNMNVILKESKAPNHYEGYLYLVTIKDINGKVIMFYWGVHKGRFDGTYWMSSSSKSKKSKKFRKLFTLPNIEVTYEVVDYGDYDSMTVEEHLKLVECKAKNNDKCANDSYGSPAFKPIRENEINKIVNNIKNGIYPIQYMDKEKAHDLDYVQTRFVEDDKLIKFISRSIDGHLGRVREMVDKDLIDPIVTVDLKKCKKLLGGNHTNQGSFYSTKGLETPYIEVPYDDIKHLSESELKALSNALNPKNQKRTNEFSIEDAVKQLVQQQNDSKIPIKHYTNEDFLLNQNFDEKEVKHIFKAAEKKIREGKYPGNWIKWKAPGWQKLMMKIKEWFQDEENGKICLYQSSLKFNLQTILDTCRDALNSKYGIVKFTLLIHHTNPDALNEWIKKILDEKLSDLDLWIGDKFEWEIIELPTERQDESMRPKAFLDSKDGKVWKIKNKIKGLKVEFKDEHI